MRFLTSLAALCLIACSDSPAGSAQETAAPAAMTDGQARAVFASGCFWCTEADFEDLDGVIDVVSGFTGGDVENPEYRQVVNGNTGHVEAVEIIYDPDTVSYEALLSHYWRNVDPFDGGGQFCDRGSTYAPAIFTLDDAQREAAQASAADVEARFGEPVEVRIRDAEVFWPAEAYHQDYAENNPIRYQRYRFGCRRDQRLRELWGDEAGGY